MSQRPNILHLFTDMQRADTIAAINNPVIKTPNLDRLCEDGVAFTNAFSPSPVCISARCSMIYGQYPSNTGCYENDCMVTDERESFMGALTDAGYRTHGIGKCHFTPDRYALRGFQTREVQEEGGLPMNALNQNHYMKYLHDLGYTHITEVHGVRGEMYYTPQLSLLPAEDHPTTWVADATRHFIREQATKDEPWYLFSSFIHPHPPFTPPTPWHKLYRPTQMPLPLMPDQHECLWTYVNRVQNRYKYQDQGRNLHFLRSMKAYYYACISFIDYQVGRILDELEESDQADNTLIVFTSDHGEFLGDYNCFGKRSMHDASSRVPMILSMPGEFEGGQVCDKPVSLVDLAPTFTNLGEASIRTHNTDGEDMRDLLSGACSREMVFSQLAYTPKKAKASDLANDQDKLYQTEEEAIAGSSSYMAVSREWKYFYSAPDHREFLFNRQTDPLETRNCQGVRFCQEAKHYMRNELVEFLRDTGMGIAINDDNTWREFPRRTIPEDPDAGLLIQDDYTPWADIALPEAYQ